MAKERAATLASIIRFAAELEPRDRSAAVGVRQWARYLGFLRIILGRYDEANGPYVEAMNHRLELRRTGVAQTFPTTPEEFDQFDRERSLEARVELDSESFYIFAKILLDRIADTFRDYFGIKLDGRGSSHAALAATFTKFCQRHTIAPRGLDGLIETLRAEIVDYRTKVIEHASETGEGTLMWGGDERVKLGIRPFSSRPEDGPSRHTIDPHALFAILEEYIALVLRFMKLHADKSTLSPQDRR
jgi:hypothetical protein